MVQISFGEVLEKTVIRDKLVTLQSSFDTMAFLSLLIKAHFTSKARIHHTQNKETKQCVRLRTMAWYWIGHTLGMGGWPASAVVWLTSWHLFSPVQFNSRWCIYIYMCSEKPIRTPPCLSEVSTELPLIWFQCSSDWWWSKFQALVYDILPSTTAVGSRKLSANKQFFVGAQTVVSLLQKLNLYQTFVL